MQYILSKEEYENMVPKEKYNKLLDNYVKMCQKYRDFINSRIHFNCINNPDSEEKYCDLCPFGKNNLNECILKQNYKL